MPVLVEHFFRHEYGRLVAMLARRVGVQHIELVEDAVQSALMAALTAWTDQAPPEEPGAWLYKVAYHRLIQDLRRESGRLKILENAAGDFSGGAGDPVDPFFPDEFRDDMLRMLFVCCDEAIPWESQLVLALKTLCGFIVFSRFHAEAGIAAEHCFAPSFQQTRWKEIDRKSVV